MSMRGYVLEGNYLKLALGLHKDSKVSPQETALALLTAIDCNELETADIILDSAHSIDIDFTDFRCHTSLMRACYIGNVTLIEKIIARGADVSYLGGKGPRYHTPLSIATSQQHLAACALLEKHGAKSYTRPII